MNKPYVGMMVLAKSIANGHSTCAPAVVTRVWQDGSPAVVNLMVLHDASSPAAETSVYLYNTEDEARDPGAPSRAAWRLPETGSVQAYASER